MIYKVCNLVSVMSLEGVIVREVNWDKHNDVGTPQDCADVMTYFNQGLQDKAKFFPYVARLSKITDVEIQNRWAAIKDQAITYVAEKEGKVVCSATLFLPDQPNLISWETYGHISLTDDPEYRNQGISTAVLEQLFKYCAKQEVPLKLHTSKENNGIRHMLEQFGFRETSIIKNYDRYTDLVEGSGDAVEYVLSTEDLKHLFN
jgi:RimJ/RimL family protein N-acetyltransferase